MKKEKCPYCHSYGVVLLKRGAIRRALNQHNRRHCIDCGTTFHQLSRWQNPNAAIPVDATFGNGTGIAQPVFLPNLTIGPRVELDRNILDVEYYTWCLRWRERTDARHSHGASSTATAPTPRETSHIRCAPSFGAPVNNETMIEPASTAPETGGVAERTTLETRIAVLEEENEALRRAAACFARHMN